MVGLRKTTNNKKRVSLFFSDIKSHERAKSDEEMQQIGSRFPIFTIEKRHAYRVHRDRRAPRGSPNRWNSIHSFRPLVETARRIKAVNLNVRVLMHWNPAVHYNMYQCEDAVNPSWLVLIFIRDMDKTCTIIRCPISPMVG